MRAFTTGIVAAAAVALTLVAAPAMASGQGDYSVMFSQRDGQEFANNGSLMIQMAVRRINDRHATRIELVGHANCYETDPMGLSRRRAELVADALVAAGVDRSLIEIRYVGGAEPGAGSALNQRVDIFIAT